jgi:hypothetical protein
MHHHQLGHQVVQGLAGGCQSGSVTALTSSDTGALQRRRKLYRWVARWLWRGPA